jgi:hypothetical protein
VPEHNNREKRAANPDVDGQQVQDNGDGARHVVCFRVRCAWSVVTTETF